MDKINLNLLNSLNKTQYCQFVKNSLGMLEFLKKDGIDVLNKLNAKEKQLLKQDYQNKPNSKVLAYCKKDNEIVKIFSLEEGDYEKHVFHDDAGKTYDAETCFNDIQAPVLFMLMLGIARTPLSYVRKHFQEF